MRCLIDVC
jgi:hypothetical protein